MDKRMDQRFKSFNGNYYVQDDAEIDGTFLDCEYGEKHLDGHNFFGPYLQSPAEVLAYSLIMAHKEILMSESNKPEFKVKLILQKVDELVDFPWAYLKEDFIEDVKKTFAQKEYDPADFMKRLEENIRMEISSIYNDEDDKFLINTVLKQIKKVVIIDKDTKKESAILQCYNVEATPDCEYEKDTKWNLISSALDTIYKQSTMCANKFYPLFKNVDFLNERWFETLIANKKLMLANEKRTGLQENEKFDACYRMKAQQNSYNDLIKLMKKIDLFNEETESLSKEDDEEEFESCLG